MSLDRAKYDTLKREGPIKMSSTAQDGIVMKDMKDMPEFWTDMQEDI